jgi:hypothetical protein
MANKLCPCGRDHYSKHTVWVWDLPENLFCNKCEGGRLTFNYKYDEVSGIAPCYACNSTCVPPIPIEELK